MTYEPTCFASCGERAWWRERGHGGAGVFALVGIGGAGKTAIADRFLREVPGVFPPHPEVRHDRSLPKPTKLFVFSFYDVPNPQVFLAQVLDWLDDRPPDKTRPRPQYTEIKARLRDEEGLLLVLDGLEKVQDDGARGSRLGHITDASLRQLLRRWHGSPAARRRRSRSRCGSHGPRRRPPRSESRSCSSATHMPTTNHRTAGSIGCSR